MGLIQNWIKKNREKKELQEGYERQLRIQKIAEGKQMSANERELLGWEEQERQKAIKNALEKIRKKDNDEFWSGQRGNPLNAPNIIKGQTLFANEQKLFNGKTTLFEQHDLFYKK